MSLLSTASVKEFGPLVCLWHDVKLQKTQLKVRSLNVTWRRDLWGHRVIVFFGNVSNCWRFRGGELGVLRVREHPLNVEVHPLTAKSTPQNELKLNETPFQTDIQQS